MTSPTSIPEANVSRLDPAKKRVRFIDNAIADLKAARKLKFNDPDFKGLARAALSRIVSLLEEAT